MFTVIARILSNNQLVGYRLSDGIQQRDATKIETWVFAKKRLINDVIASGNELNPVISGTNGFELKKLPEVQYSYRAEKAENAVSIDRHDIDAFGIRQLVNYCHNEMKRFIPVGITETLINSDRKELDRYIKYGKINTDNIRVASKYFKVLNTLYNPYGKSDMAPVIGYRIKYTGKEPINIDRITVTDDHMIINHKLQPNSEICLSRVELAYLVPRVQIGCTLENGYVIHGIKYYDTLYDNLNGYYFKFSNRDISVNSPDVKKPITDFIDQSTMLTYFIPMNKNIKSVDKNTDSTKVKILKACLVR